jgi:hypothetical protein
MAKFGTCTGVSLNGTLVEAKMFTLALECKNFKCPLKTHDGANAKFGTIVETKRISVWPSEITAFKILAGSVLTSPSASWALKIPKTYWP